MFYECLAPCRLSEYEIATYDTWDLITALLAPALMLLHSAIKIKAKVHNNRNTKGL